MSAGPGDRDETYFLPYAESDWRVWRAARNASSVNGGRLPYSLGTVASAARPSQLNTARQTSLGRFRPIASISQEVLTRKEGTMPLAPCPLCAASIPPHLTRSDDVEGEKRASIRRRSRTLTGSGERTSGQKKRDGAPSAFFLHPSLPVERCRGHRQRRMQQRTVTPHQQNISSRSPSRA